MRASFALIDAPPLEMAEVLYRRIFTGARFGDATPKAATRDQDVCRSWIFFGDPSIKLK